MTHPSHTLALQVFVYIAGHEDYLLDFLQQSGVTPQTARRDLAEPEMMGAVLDFLLADEKLLVGFCKQEGITPQEIWRHRGTLPGAPQQTL